MHTKALNGIGLPLGEGVLKSFCSKDQPDPVPRKPLDFFHYVLQAYSSQKLF